MLLKARIYIGLVISMGALALILGLYRWDVSSPTRFIWYLAFAIPASCLKVSLPGIKIGTMSVLFIFLLGATVELTLSQTLVVGSVCVIAQSLWHSKFGASLIQITFSVAVISLAITATDIAYRAVPSFSGPLRLAVAVTIFFVTNTFPIAVVIGLTEKRSIWFVWKTSYLWCFPYYLVGAGIVGVAKFSSHLLDWQTGLLVLPVVYIIYRSYRMYLKQLQDERNRAEKEHQHAKQLEALHTQTVAALDSAITANARLDAVFRASPLAFMTLDRTNKVIAWNAAAEQIFGWAAEEVLGKPLPFTSGNDDEIQSIIARTLHGELVSGVEMKQSRRDGSRFDAAVWTTTLPDAEGISGILVTIDDVSIRKHLQEELRLAQKMEAVGRLAGGVAHDFNNLLTAIIGYNGFLMDSLADRPELLGYTRYVLGAAERAGVLTRRLLTFSRRQISAPKVLNINTCVTNIQNLLTRVIGEDIEIVTHLQPDLGNVQIDPVELDQIMMNLAVNARDAMPDGGQLTFETANVVTTPEQARKTGFAPGEYVMLKVRDQGCGMDAETKSHLFEPFFTTKEQGKGTGLGMSIVYGVVQQNGGSIAVESEPGAGATFSLYFPRCTNAEEKSTPVVANVVSLAKATATIVLVEDEPVVRQLATALLSAEGYRVLDAGTPAEAIELVAGYRDPIDLLVTDVLMPGMRGNELAERLCSMRPGLSVLYMSGYSDSTFLNPGALMGASFLQKPFVATDLMRAVSKALASRVGASSSTL